MVNQPWNDEDFDTPHLDPEDDPEVAKQMLTNIDKGIVGSVKPRVEHTKEYWTNPNSWWDSDNDARSPLEADLDDVDG